MSKFIDYFYAPISGYAYLGEKKLVEIAKRCDAQIHFKPIDIASVFAKSETIAPFKQSQTRINYRLKDLKRIAVKNKLPIHPKPKHWPVPVELAATTIYSSISLGVDAHRISFAILSAVYAADRDVSDPEAIKKILTELGLDANEIMENRSSCAILYEYESATDEAIELGVFGSPSYVFQGEIFFGQDRLDLLEDALKA